MCAHEISSGQKESLPFSSGRWKALWLWYVGNFEIKHFSVNATALQNLASYKIQLAIIIFLLYVPGTLTTSFVIEPETLRIQEVVSKKQQTILNLNNEIFS